MLLKKQIILEVSYFAKNIYQTVTGTSGLYYNEDLKSDSDIPYIYIYIYLFASMRALQK